MKIKVNSKLEEILPCSIMAFIKDKKLNMESLVVEYNFNIVKKAEWDCIILKENDNLELLSFVGGG